MALNSSWAPDETPQTILNERCWLQGAIVTAVAYGVTVSLYCLSFYLLVREKNRIEYKKRLFLLIFITVSFFLGTVFMVALAAFTQMAFVDDRNYPGGPNAYEQDMFSVPINRWGNVALVMSNWWSDALVVWRFKVIYQRCRIRLWIIMLFPVLMLAASVAMGIMYLLQISSGSSPYGTFLNGINFTLPFLSISLALNIILTIAIVLRLLTFRYHIVSLMGPNYGTQYTSIAAMMIESAALYSIMSVIFLVLLLIGNPVSKVFSQSWIEFQIIATLLIVFRVAQGKGWTKSTDVYAMTRTDAVELGNMRFASHGAFVTLTSSADVGKSAGTGASQAA